MRMDTMQELKNFLLKWEGRAFTCLYMPTEFKEDYEIFIKPHLRDGVTLGVFQNKSLCQDERLFRRYIVLDFFEQEMRAIGRIK